MVLGDLGCVELADHHARLQKKARPSDHDVNVTTPAYRPPDVFLGNQRFGAELDMRSFGCLAAELHTRRPLVAPSATEGLSGKDFLEAIREIVGRPGQEALGA